MDRTVREKAEQLFSEAEELDLAALHADRDTARELVVEASRIRSGAELLLQAESATEVRGVLSVA